MILYIVRHGDPDYVTDTLTERGRIQAEAVGKRMFDSGINQIYSSPMGRAKQTAEPACRLLGLECNIEDWAAEIRDERLTPVPDGVLKSVTMVPPTYYRENGYIDLGYNESDKCPAIGLSRMTEARDRLARDGNEFLERLGYREENGVYRILRPSEDKVALFCHSVMGRAWISSLLHIPIHLMWGGFIYTHTGVTVLQFKNYESGFTVPRLLCYSDMSHLYAEKLDMKYDNGIEI